MKKVFLFIVSVLLLSTQIEAQSLIPLSTQIIDKSPVGHPFPKSPVQPPKVYIEDHTLSFAADHPDYILIIKDEENNTLYTTTVFSTVTEVLLPSNLLQCDCQIELIMGNWLFAGWITF